MADPNKPDTNRFDAGELAAGMFEFSGGGVSPARYETPKVSSLADVEKLPEGREFIDPEGKTRLKPYTVRTGDAESFRRVPEGGEFVDPQGVRRRKPTYEPLEIGTQSLVSLARGNERQIEQILADKYGKENVKREPLTNELYVEKDGKFYKPNKGFVAPVIGELVGAAAPTALGTAGGVLGAAGGPVGAAAGGVGGAVAGENINQLILSALGYSATPAEFFKSLGKEAAYTAAGGALGEVGGRVVGRASQALPAFQKLLPSAAARFVGAVPEKTQIAAELARRGYSVPLTAYAAEVPAAQKTLEFARQFRKEGGPLEKQLERYTDKELLELFQQAGVQAPSSFTRFKEAIPMEPLGKALKEATVQRDQAAVTRLESAIDKYKQLGAQRARLTQAEFTSQQRQIVSEFEAAAAEQQRTGQAMVDGMFTEVENMSRQLAGEAGITLNTGELVRNMETQIRDLRKAMGSQAETLYTTADAAAGNMKPNVAPLRADVNSLLNQLPTGFEGQYGYIVKALKDVKRGDVTFGQLHNLRSMLRHDVDWATATNTPTEGAKKKLLGSIQSVLDDPKALPPLKEASRLLKVADDFYAKNFPKFKNEQIRWTLKQVQDGVPPDAGVLAERFIQAGQSEQTRMLKKVAGPQLWRGVLAADTQSMLDRAATTGGNYDINEFVKQIERRVKNNTLKEAYGDKQALQLQSIAARLKAYSGGEVPVQVTQGDTLIDVMRKASEYADIAKRAAQLNPSAALKADAERMARVEKLARDNLDKELGQNPLSSMFRANPSIGGIAAAERILASPDAMLAVSRTFGPQSTEAQMLRQIWWQSFFQRDIKDMSRIASEVRNMEPSVQRFLFPETPTADVLKSVQKIGREMEFLFPTELADVGSSIAGANRILNPTAYVPGGRALRNVPGVNFLARYGLGWFYTTAEWALSHPKLALFVEKGLSGSEAEREAAREVLQASYEKWLMRGRFMGYGAGAAVPQFVGKTTPAEQQPAVLAQPSRREKTGETAPTEPAMARPSWRDKMK
jgi:hypothetical protein